MSKCTQITTELSASELPEALLSSDGHFPPGCLAAVPWLGFGHGGGVEGDDLVLTFRVRFSLNPEVRKP